MCGTRAPSACAACGEVVTEGFRFCPTCGTPVAGHPAPAAASPPQPVADDPTRLGRDIPELLAAKIRANQGGVHAGERKLVTVMFSDLVGSTAIAERLDPEEFRDLLEQYLAIAFREVYRVEGIITQLAGDGVMALFGAPIAHEDAPYRGVCAALAIRDALAELSAELRASGGVELRVRIGVHTGPVVVGAVGSDLKMDYTAVGDTTNLAQALEAAAAPGTVLISEATHRLVRGFFEVLPARQFGFGGNREPVVAFEVRGLSAATTPMAVAEARGLTPLVGRGEELAQLAACVDRLAGSLPQVVTIVGDAGSGKSRLLHELKSRLTDLPVTVFEGRCSAMTQSVPYLPWVTMLRQYFGLAADDGEPEARAKIARTLGADAADLAPSMPALFKVLSLRDDSASAEIGADEDTRRVTFEAVAAVVRRASQRQPVVMIVEDVHWIDEPSREMLELAVARPKRSRVMIVISHRPDHQPSWRVRGALTQLTLGPLSDVESTGIIRAVAGGALPPELERRIVRKAEGNPLFTEEITRTLVDGGYLLRSDGRVRLTRPVDDIRMPGTVEELIGARLDRLGAHAKRVVQVAAVLGRQFHRAELVQLLAGEGIDVAGELAGLEDRGVIHRATMLGGDELRFGESLTQEVAYEGLLLRQRRELHARIGSLIAALPGEPTAERAALLAHHFARSDDRARAVGAFLDAARRAERVPSFLSAVRFYRDAFETADGLLQSGAQGAELPRQTLHAAYGLCRMAVIYGVAGLDEAERAARRGRQLAEQLDDTEAFVDLCSMQGSMAMSTRARDTFTSGFAIVEEGLAVAERAGLALAAARAARALAMGHLYDGRFEQAERGSDAVLAALARVDPPDRPSDLALGTRVMRDRLLFYRDDPAGSIASATTTFETAVRVGNRTLQTVSAATVALAHMVRAEYEAARRWVDASLEVALAVGNVGATRSAAAIGLLSSLEDGEAATSRYTELLEQDPVGTTEPLAAAIVIEALLATGSLRQAEQLAERAYAAAGGRLREAGAALALGEVRLRMGAAAEAEESFERARAIAVDLGVSSIAAGAMLGLGELAVARGNPSDGTRLFTDALATYRRLGLLHYAARATRLLAEAETGVQQSA